MISGSQPADDLSNNQEGDLTTNQSPGWLSAQENGYSTGNPYAAFFILLTLTTIIFIPVFRRGLPTGIDSDRHFRWAIQFSESLKEPGVFYPRWLASANNNQGSPVTLYYPPLSFYAVAFFKLFINDTQTALIWSCWLALLLSGFSMFVFARSFFSIRFSLLAAAFYLLAPYHLFDLFQGSSLAEFWSFVFVPLIFDATYRIVKTRSLKAVAYLALSYALSLFTHVPITFIVTLSLPIFALCLTRNLKTLLQIAAGLLLGAGISAIFLASVAFEREYVPINAVLKQDYTQYFLFDHARRARKTRLFSQNIDDFVIYTETADIRFLIYTEQIGWPLLLLFVIATVVLLFNRKPFGNLFKRHLWLIGSGMLTALGLLMTSKISSPLWRAVEYFRYLQFPSRWLVIATAGISIVVAAAFGMLSAKKKSHLVYAALLTLAIIVNLLVSGFAIGRAPHDSQAFDPARLRRETPEYRPIWWDKELHEEEELSPCTVANGKAEVRAVVAGGIHQEYELKVSEAAVLNFRTLYFPSWVAHTNGRKLPIIPSDTGHIQIQVEPGEYPLALDFDDTRPRFFGEIISAISLLCAIALLLIPHLRKKPGIKSVHNKRPVI
jgi:hypothetical protein